jgi:two-component system, OmpR family, sensor histidine kinase PrrB
VRSLRGRLTLGVLVVLAAVMAAAGAAAFHEIDRSEREALDDRLKRTAELTRPAAVAAVQDEVPGDDERLNAVLRATGSSLRVRLGKTALVDAGPTPPRHGALPRGLSTFTGDGRRYRAYVTTLDDPDLGGTARLEVVSALGGLEQRIDDLERRVALIGLGGLVLVGLLAWLTALLLLRPLRRLRAVTAEIAQDEDLGRRVPDDRGPTELRSVARSFNAMLARLGRSAADRERALAATRRFAADAGHELRTPLTSVQTTLSVLKRHPELDDARRSEMLGDALEQQRRLVDLLDGLQALARGDVGPATLAHAPVDLAELVDEVATRAGAGVRATLPDEPVVVEGWEPGLRMLVENLVVNAVRHGRSAVAVTVTAGDVGGAVLTVDDDGPGIPEADRDRIFEPFARLEGTTAPGSGLGLALVAQQVGHHGATVAIERSELGGARFVVRF